jgi:hypothetical protein
VLSAWPAAITDRSFPKAGATVTTVGKFVPVRESVLP